MGKYKHEGKGRNISIGGGRERADLFKDMSGGYNAMGDSNSPNYQYNGSAFKQRYSSPMEKYGPLHGNAFGHAMQKAGGDYEKAKSMLEMKGSPMHQGVYSEAPEPKGNMEGLKKKKIIKPKPKAKQKIHRYIEQKENGKVVKTIGTKPGSPATKIGDPNKKMDRLSARHKSLYDRFEMGQTSYAEEQKMYKLEDKMEKVGKKIKKNKSKNK